jgi:choline-sulfatase
VWWLALACREPPPPQEDPRTHSSEPAPHSSAPHSAVVEPGPPRGLVLVSIDTTRLDHLGAYGEARGLTPALDAFAATARRFTQARSAAPWTKPAMGSVMTNLRPPEHGVMQWEDQFRRGQPTLATVLHRRGYHTEAYVSHTAFSPWENRFHVGFDTFVTTWTEQPVPGSPGDVETSSYLTDRAIEAFERLSATGEPFLLWVHYFDPHDEYLDHEKPLSLGTDVPSRYAEEIAFTDAHLGRLLAATAAAPTVPVVVFADHGEELWDHGELGHAHTVYDELVHVPLLVRHPALAPGVDDTPVGTIDLAPSALWALGEAPDPAFPGASFLPVAAPAAVAHETRRSADLRGLTDWPWKGVIDLATGERRLYDLAADPGELVDVGAEHPEVAAPLEARMRALWPELP